MDTFERITFWDEHARKCILQQATDSTLWLGLEGSRMRLDAETARRVAGWLESWLETGRLKG